MTLASLAESSQIEIETAHFTRFLPRGMTWAEFDEVMLRSITIASIDQWWNGSSGFAVWPEDCERWLIYHLDANTCTSVKFCVATGFRRLLLQNRVRAANTAPHRLPSVMPLPPYQLDEHLVEQHFPHVWARRPAPPPIGWDAFKTVVERAIDTLTTYARLEHPLTVPTHYGPSYPELVDFLVGRGWDHHDLGVLLPVILSRHFVEDCQIFRNGFPHWHPALVLHENCVNQSG